MFGPQGLLSKIEAEGEEEHHNFPSNQPSNTFPEYTVTVGQRRSDEKQKDSEMHESFENLYQMEVALQELNATSEAHRSIQFLPLRDLPPLEAAFSIEKISKRIFSLLEPEDLLRCRLVSSSWLRMATNKKLVKINKEVIWIKYKLEQNGPTKVTLKGRTIYLKDVTDFLDSLGSHPSLYSASLHLKMTIAPNYFTRFIDRYGFVVTNLKVTFRTTEENFKAFVYQMNLLLEFVTKLLTKQMPNLETLKIYFEEYVKFAGEIDSQLLERIQKNLYCAGKHNQNLRFIQTYRPAPHEIIDSICCLAPKLEELLNYDLGFWAKNTHRLYLMKELRFMPSRHFLDQVDALEALVTKNTEAKWNLKRLFMIFDSFSKNPEIQHRLTALLVKSLEKSCHSLEELILKTVYVLPGAVFPQMPRVKLLHFITSSNSNKDDKSEWRELPHELSLAYTFPNLREINLSGYQCAMNFLDLCKNEEVASVQRLIVYEIKDEQKEIFRGRFPNAVVLSSD